MAAAADLHQMATTLRAAATTLPSALDAVALHAGSDVWRGPASERFVTELQDHRRRLGSLADELQLAARVCLTDAAALETPAAALPPSRTLHIPPRFS